MQRWTESRHVPRTHFEEQNSKKQTILPASKRERMPMAVWQIPWWEAPEHCWQLRIVLIALEAGRRLQMGLGWNKHWLWTVLQLSDGTCKCYRRTRMGDRIWMAELHFLRPRNTLCRLWCPTMDRIYPSQRNSLIKKYNRQVKGSLSKMGGDTGLKCWLMCFYECVFTLNMSGILKKCLHY